MRAPAQRRMFAVAMSRRGSWVAALAGALSLAAVLSGPAAVAKPGHRHPARHHKRPKPPRIVELPVAFSVVNTNTSKLPCLGDGLPYVVRGHLIAPRWLLGQPRRAVTLYLHGNTVSEAASFRFTAVPGYDVGRALASAGHASLVIDRIGYDASGHPPGLQLCAGSQADVAHQIVGQLRTGSYNMGAAIALSFARVAIAGQSAGGNIAEIEAASFADVDALIDIDWADTGFGAGPLSHIALAAGPVCARGGDHVEDNGDGPSGYAYMWSTPEQEAQDTLFNPDPAVVKALGPLLNRDPCGSYVSAVAAVVVDRQAVASVAAPVLLIFGDHDAIFPPPNGDQQRALFSGSQDVTLVHLADAGHTPMLDRGAGAFRTALEKWLRAHGF
jgi:pimeloyl-ACP methyl ester carboxylesterase